MVSQELVGTVLEPTTEATTSGTTTPRKASWKDFPLEDHLKGWMREQGNPVPPNCNVVAKVIFGNTYRVNFYKVGVMASSITDSFTLKITETPEGYVFTDITKGRMTRPIKEC